MSLSVCPIIPGPGPGTGYRGRIAEGSTVKPSEILRISCPVYNVTADPGQNMRLCVH